MDVTHSTHVLHNTSVIVLPRVASPSCVSIPLPRLSPRALETSPIRTVTKSNLLARARTALRASDGDAAAAALVQPHEWCNGAGGAALLYMVVRDDWLAASAPGTA